jgi:hypothetical protein|tara:strand:+ start:10067 stop:10618 length:552 start_codon:yes stop_codon:yes gene_type:complete
MYPLNPPQVPPQRPVGNSLYSTDVEKTFIDKTMAKEDIAELKELMLKETWTLSEMFQVLYLVAGTERKLEYYNGLDRYILSMYFVTIRSLVRYVEGNYKYKEKLIKRKDEFFPETFIALDNGIREAIGDIKFLIDDFLINARSTQSIGGHAFNSIYTTGFEMRYQGLPNQPQIEPQKQKRGLF